MVEILVTISIVLVLASLLFPWLSNVRAKFGATGCLQNLRSLGMAVHSYAGDHNGELPMNEAPRSPGSASKIVWVEVLMPYGNYALSDITDPVKIRQTILACPSETDFRQPVYYCYSMNIDLNHRLQGEKARVRVQALNNAAKYVLFSDSFRSHILNTSHEHKMREWTQATKRHSGRPNFLYADGHVASFDKKPTGYIEVQSAEKDFYYNLYFANGIPPSER